MTPDTASSTAASAAATRDAGRPGFVPDKRRKPYSVDEVLKHELARLRPDWKAGGEVAVRAGQSEAPGWLRERTQALGRWLRRLRSPESQAELWQREQTCAESLRAIYRTIHEKSAAADQPGAKDTSGALTALCLSGGGIRSATFNLGVLQALAAKKLLGHFDYLSSVSGGGYIASWLRTWMARQPAERAGDKLVPGAEVVLRDLGKSSGDPLHPEPEPVRNLRKFSNYLTPRLGLFSGDTWAAAAIVTRNILLNWLVIVPLIAAAIALPLSFLVFVKSAGYGGSAGARLLVGALVVELVASTTVHIYRRRRFGRRRPEAFFVTFCAIPIWVAATLLAWAALELDLPWLYGPDGASAGERSLLAAFSVVWCIVIPLAGWVLSFVVGWFRTPVDGEVSRPAWIEGLALLLSGALAAALMYLMVVNLLGKVYELRAVYVVLATPLLLALYLVARTLFVGLTSAPEGRTEKFCTSSAAAEDADREWWARLSGWLMLMVATWLIVTGIVFLSGYLLERFEDLKQVLITSVSGMGGIAGAIAALIAKSDEVPATDAEEKKKAEAQKEKPKVAPKWGLRFAVPIFVVSVIVLIGWLTMWMGELATGTPGIFNVRHAADVYAPDLAWSLGWKVLGGAFALLGLAVLNGMFVNVNRFSLHAMYRNRLVRAYLGASNVRVYRQANAPAPARVETVRTGRDPDPFTGFDPRDNCKLYDLWRPGQAERPMPIINTTLNLTEGLEDLAWQERKAESFSMTPFFCGNYLGGYRPTYDYGGANGGISVGTAVSISGAAASPNMGYSSSPALSFLMTLLNVRLGVWLGNTNEMGDGFYGRPGPGQAVRPLLNELLGRTNRSGRYVSLSDGGHFDNLGLYEVVLRRCRHVLVSDSGQDEKFAFEDLGNAIRKVRIDFGIPIVFKHKILIGRRDDTAQTPDQTVSGIYCAVATIHYEAIDPGAQPGTIVYIKPTVVALPESPIPYDVYSYWRQDSNFPHQSTGDQWFSESQFESYRALGEFIVTMLCGGDPVTGTGGENKGKSYASIAELIKDLTTVIKKVEKEAEAREAAKAAGS